MVTLNKLLIPVRFFICGSLPQHSINEPGASRGSTMGLSASDREIDVARANDDLEPARACVSFPDRLGESRTVGGNDVRRQKQRQSCGVENPGKPRLGNLHSNLPLFHW